jgi:hypothetical protein
VRWPSDVRLPLASKVSGRGVAALGNAGDEVLGRRGVGEVGELAGGEAGVGDAREPAVVGVGEVAPGGGESGRLVIWPV